MLTFENTWPYEKTMDDIYLQECPFCRKTSVLTSFSEDSLELAKEGIKQLLIMPCCYGKLTILKADDDYLWADEKLRENR